MAHNRSRSPDFTNDSTRRRAADDRKEQHDDDTFYPQAHAGNLLRGGAGAERDLERDLGDYALQTPERMLADERAAPGAAVGGAGETFDVADSMAVLRSVPSVPDAALPSMRSAPVYRDAGLALDAGRGAHGLLDPSMLSSTAATFGKGMMPDPSAMLPSSDTKLHDRYLYDESVIVPPVLPPPPYPLERHTYAVPPMSGVTALEVVRAVKKALKDTLVDAAFIEGECRWECTIVSSGKRCLFNLRLHSVSAGFCLEFQRRTGSSIVFNVAVRGVLQHVSTTHFGGKPLAVFERSEKDKEVPASAGFYVASFDIPDVPLDLGVPLDFTSGGLLGADSADAVPEEELLQLAAADKGEEVDGVQALLNMAATPGGGDVAVEGITGMAILSRGEGRDALLEKTHLAGVVSAVVAALRSRELCQRCGAATLAANLTEDERSHGTMVSGGCLDEMLEVARRPHTAGDAHVRRECLRAVHQLAQGRHRDAVISRGGIECMQKVSASCSDHRMATTAHLALQQLR